MDQRLEASAIQQPCEVIQERVSWMRRGGIKMCLASVVLKVCGLVCLQRFSGNTRTDTAAPVYKRSQALFSERARAFYLCQDPASAVSGELVCGALREHEALENLCSLSG